MAQLPAGIRFIISFSRDQWYRAFIFILTFLLYASFHLSRKPISIVKGELHKYCTAWDEADGRFSSQSAKSGSIAPRQLPDNETDCGWAPFDKNNYQQLLGALDYSFLCAYAVGMYLRYVQSRHSTGVTLLYSSLLSPLTIAHSSLVFQTLPGYLAPPCREGVCYAEVHRCTGVRPPLAGGFPAVPFPKMRPSLGESKHMCCAHNTGPQGRGFPCPRHCAN